MKQKREQKARVLDGSTFFISDANGDACGRDEHGFFFHDTRFLSKSILTVNGKQPELLSTKEVDYFAVAFFLTMPYSTVFEQHPVSIIRNRFVGHGAFEQITVANYGKENTKLTIELELNADFADLFEVKQGKAQNIHREVQISTDSNSQLTFTYENDGNIFRQTVVNFSKPFKLNEQNKLEYQLELNPREEWQLDFTIAAVWDSNMHTPKYDAKSFGRARPEMKQSMQEWLDSVPTLTTGEDSLFHSYNRSTIDLAALRFYPKGDKESPVIAAGLPWFMAVFGRDNLITSYQCAHIAPELGISALRALAKRQGREDNPFKDEEPGKILHELRFDELTVAGKLPYSPYFGSADSTPLFLILLHEIYLWTGDANLVREMKQAALNALKWIDEYGDRDGDGFVEFETRSPVGLRNQCWKDSSNSIQFSNGKIADTPLATVEIQGYVYDAKMRTADLADKVWKEPKLAEKLRKQAAELKRKFNDAFWIQKRGGYLAVALDKDKRQVDSMTSNMGQCLWSGIVDEEKAEAIANNLFTDEMYSGWGIRTMSEKDAGYNPIEYHCGTVWPHDNSLIAQGLARYGFKDKANKIIIDMLNTSHFFMHRLPEVFAGYPTQHIDCPVEYPTASSPQAWATGAIPLFMRTMLGLEPNPEEGTVSVDPDIPAIVQFLELKNLRLYQQLFDIRAEGTQAEISVNASEQLLHKRIRKVS